MLLSGLTFSSGMSWSQAGSVFASWNANQEVDLSGYRVYSGRASRVYQQFLSVSKKQNSAKLVGLSSGLWFFVVTALDTAGNESGFSEETSLTVSGAQELTKPRPASELKVNGKTGSVVLAKGDTLSIEFKTSRILTDGTLVSKDSLSFRAWLLVPNQGWKSITPQALPIYGFDRVSAEFSFPTETAMNLTVTVFYKGRESEDSLPVVVTFQDAVNITVKVKITF